MRVATDDEEKRESGRELGQQGKRSGYYERKT